MNTINGMDVMRIFAMAGLTALATLVLPAAGFAQAQDVDIPPVAIDCEDGTQLQVVFDGDTAIVTPAEGAKPITLNIEDSASGFVYRSARFALIGKGDEIQWIVGKKAPVQCRAEGEFTDVFDEPVGFDEEPLKPDPKNPEAERKVTCYRYGTFAVKEVDYGEKGAQKLALIAPKAKCVENDPADRVLSGFEGYFLGAKGNIVFFNASDGFNGGLPFSAFKVEDLSLVFEDSFEGDSLESLTVEGGRIEAVFQRATTTSCSLFTVTDACLAAIGQEVKGLGTTAKIPDCRPAYETEQKRTPDYAAEIAELPAVISHRARLVAEAGAVSVEALEGEVFCRIPE